MDITSAQTNGSKETPKLPFVFGGSLTSELILQNKSPKDYSRKAFQEISQTAALRINDFASIQKCFKPYFSVIDFFSGCGGMSAGFHIASKILPSYKVQTAFDIDEIANKTYFKNLGLQPLNEDISKFFKSPKRIKSLLASNMLPSIVIGCAPCQGFSSHRNAAGKGDRRNSLFMDFARLAVKLDPQVILVENVPELLTNSYWQIVEKSLSLFEKAGYFVNLGIYNMAQFGVPQERFRALMIAMKKPFDPPKGFLMPINFRTVRESIGSLPPVISGQIHQSDPMHYSAKHKLSTLAVIKSVPKDGGNRPQGVGPPCLQRAKERFGKEIFEDVYGRLYWDRPSITITAYARNPASGRYIHPEQDRALTVREAALLQGFPSNYQFCGSMDNQFRQIGNAVPPVFSTFLALHILGEILSPPIPKPDFAHGIREPIGKSFSRLIPSLKSQSRQMLQLN